MEAKKKGGEAGMNAYLFLGWVLMFLAAGGISEFTFEIFGFDLMSSYCYSVVVGCVAATIFIIAEARRG